MEMVWLDFVGCMSSRIMQFDCETINIVFDIVYCLRAKAVKTAENGGL